MLLWSKSPRPSLDTAGASDRPGLHGSHPEEYVSYSCTVVLSHKLRERWNTVAPHR